MKIKRILILSLVLCLALGLMACGNKGNAPAPSQQGTPGTAAPAAPKIARIGESFAYPSLDAHKDYYGWYTSIYGMTETLFRVDETMSVQPLLAEKAEVSEDGRTWTVTLNSKAAFSNGSAVTADLVVRNFQRLAQLNDRFAYLADFEMKAVDEKTLTITTPAIYPTMLSDLTAPEMAIMDLDHTTDFDNAPICTGPFQVKSFQPEGTVEVEKNAAYWNGNVKLDGVVFYYLADDESKLMAMQSKELDGYTSVTAAAREIYAADPATYTLTDVPATRLQFYVLNENRMSDAVRRAVNLTVDCAAVAEYLGGTVTAAVGPFNASAPYGQVSKPAPDQAAAKAALEADGYTLNSSGIYEKDGQALCLNICYYKARSLDSIAILMQEQLRAIGVDAVLTSQEDPDSTYVATGDFDIALYCMIADKAGDPYYCIDALFRQDSRWSIAGFHSDECEALINELQYETDIARRATLANQIVQMVIDDNAFGFVGLFNQVTVTANGLRNISERIPFDYYRVTAETDLG